MQDAIPSQKRLASELTEALDTGNSSSSTAPATGRKRAPDVPTENVAGSIDIISLHVGAAYDATAKGSISEIHSPPRIVPQAEKAGFAPIGRWT